VFLGFRIYSGAPSHGTSKKNVYTYPSKEGYAFGHGEGAAALNEQITGT